ncbi:curlin [Lacinutrix sp. Bg11-31]|uniref:curlin n=1 Tax=Lacinutrix sp. Bg11-31 TaxID=2057808 RepID=UPI000C31A898|nr:curlin [Lacinutrix sp. Bg11-31]AUC82230.1 curlin [Lacinutrix sp. Bg11-31]
MKKVILGAAALLFSGAMMAQVSQNALKDTNGNNSVDAQLSVDLSGTGNQGEAVQTGNTNKLQVLQAGTNQSSFSIQGDGAGTGDNRARIWQTGDVSGISGVENAADVRQLGSGNQSTTRQEGDQNEAVTRQGMKDGGISGGNKAYINHGTAENGELNYAMVEQDGQGNSSKTVQSYDNNEARTVQEGDGNMSGIRQKSGPNGSLGNSALAEQYGNMNATKIYQDGHSQTAASLQVGNSNKANQTQLGNGNWAKVNQGGDTSGPIDNLGSVQADMDGYLNSFADPTYTNGSDNTGNGSKAGLAKQYQSGDGNSAYSGQWGDDGEDSNYSEQSQIGDDNRAYVNQNAYGPSNGGANYGRQDQAGNGNFAVLGQNGRDHVAYQRQYGNYNDATATQKGKGNLMSSYQSGDGNVAISAQRGHYNQTLVVQKSGTGDFSGHSFVSSQNVANGMPNGNGGNTISVLQLGPTGDIMNDGEGCDFQAPSDLDMPGGVGGFDLDAPCTPSTSGC